MRQTRLVYRWTRHILLVSLTLTNIGCGFIFSHAPPEGHEQMNYFTCTESDAGPVIDIIWAALNVAGALVVSSTPDEYYDPGATALGGLAWGIFSTSAAVVGMNKSTRCRAAKRLLAERQSPPAPLPTPVAGAATATPVQNAPENRSSLVRAVVIEPSVDTLTIGSHRQLVASAHTSSGATLEREFAWASSNDAVARVNNAGLVIAVAAGSATIAASTENVVGMATILVVVRR